MSKPRRLPAKRFTAAERAHMAAEVQRRLSPPAPTTPPAEPTAVATARPYTEEERAFTLAYLERRLATGERKPPQWTATRTADGVEQILPDPTTPPLVFNARLAQAAGSAHDEANEARLVELAQVVNATSAHPHPNEIQAMLGAMLDIAPKDALEGMLAAQLVSTHKLAMHHLVRAAQGGTTVELAAFHQTAANRLLRIFTTQLDALNRHRGRGPSEQRVTVEHVHVHAGGQAVVGAVNTEPRTGGNDRYRVTRPPLTVRRQDTRGPVRCHADGERPMPTPRRVVVGGNRPRPLPPRPLHPRHAVRAAHPHRSPPRRARHARRASLCSGHRPMTTPPRYPTQLNTAFGGRLTPTVPNVPASLAALVRDAWSPHTAALDAARSAFVALNAASEKLAELEGLRDKYKPEAISEARAQLMTMAAGALKAHRVALRDALAKLDEVRTETDTTRIVTHSIMSDPAEAVRVTQMVSMLPASELGLAATYAEARGQLTTLAVLHQRAANDAAVPEAVRNDVAARFGGFIAPAREAVAAIADAAHLAWQMVEHGADEVASFPAYPDPQRMVHRANGLTAMAPSLDPDLATVLDPRGLLERANMPAPAPAPTPSTTDDAHDDTQAAA